MIGEIINAVEKNMDATQCSERACNGGSKCIAHNFWMDFNDNVNEFLMIKIPMTSFLKEGCSTEERSSYSNRII